MSYFKGKKAAGHKIKLVDTLWIGNKRFYNCFCECGALLALDKPRESCRISHSAHVERHLAAKVEA